MTEPGRFAVAVAVSSETEESRILFQTRCSCGGRWASRETLRRRRYRVPAMRREARVHLRLRAVAHALRGVVYAGKEMLPQARADFTKALDLSPNQRIAREGLSRLSQGGGS